MNNRAKCKLCDSIIESRHVDEYANCACGEIGVGGGDLMYCMSGDWDNFTRVDDMGNEIMITVKDKEETASKPSKDELLVILDDMIKTIESLPSHVMQTPVTHYDLLSSLLLISSIFKADRLVEGAIGGVKDASCSISASK